MVFSITIVVLIYIGFILSWFCLKNEVSFDPNFFLTEYAKFLCTLTLAVLTYIMVNEYLRRRRRITDASIVEQRALFFTQEIGRVTVETSNALRELFESSSSSLTAKDAKTILDANISFMHLLDGQLLAVLDLAGTTLPQTKFFSSFSDYRREVHALVQDLVTLNDNTDLLRDFFTRGIGTLDSVGISIHAIIQKCHASGGIEKR